MTTMTKTGPFAAERTQIHEAAIALAHRINDHCTGSSEVVRYEDLKLMGNSETVGALATQPGYVEIYVAGRHLGQITGQVETAFWGDRLDRLDIREHKPRAVQHVARTLRARAEAASLDPDVMVDHITGNIYAIEEIAAHLCSTACDQLRGSGRAITTQAIVDAALAQISPDAFTGEA